MHLPPILYEDEFLLAFDKPSGLPVTAGRGQEKADSLMARVQAKFGRGTVNAHRLETEASGVVVCARTKPALDFLSGEFQSKMAQAVFNAFAVLLPPGQGMKVIEPLRAASGGLPETFTIELPVGPDEQQPERMRITRKRDGKESRTEIRVLEQFGRWAWLEGRAVTGRQHQLRLHLAAVGAPVLNDPVYGDPEIRLLLSDLKKRYKGREEERPLIGRLALHAGALTLRHPATRAPLTLLAPLPRDFAIALKYLRKFSPHPAGSGSPAELGPDG